MKVIVYVEGPSDKASMESLLEPLLVQRKREGVLIEFFETGDGDRKRTLLTKTPIKAVRILSSQRDSVVVALPDLHPFNRVFPHTTPAELSSGMSGLYRKELGQRGIDPNPSLLERFRVFCFKHDLEAMVLAAREQLAERLGVPEIAPTWKEPVEDQDDDEPPKLVVERLFQEHHERYRSTVDAPLILACASLDTVVERCPQCFAPFVEFLRNVGRPAVSVDT